MRTRPLLIIVVCAVFALALALVVWPAVATSVLLTYLALGFAAGAATVRAVER
jgi:hypothetical protein